MNGQCNKSKDMGNFKLLVEIKLMRDTNWEG